MSFGTVLAIPVVTHNIETIVMILIYFLGFFTMVCVYAMVTNRLNQKAKCDHNWEDKADGVIKCSKCNKSIKLQNHYDEHIAA